MSFLNFVWGLYFWDDKLMITGMKMSRMKMKRVSQHSGGLREAIWASEGSLYLEYNQADQ